jgi:transposase
MGLEVHKDSIAVASVAKAPHAEGVYFGTIGTRQRDSDTLCRQRQAKSTDRLFVSAAGPCGYWLSRALMKKGSLCAVVAPSLRPKKAGARVKTDCRDAGQLARLLRSGDRTAVSVPAGQDDALRDLSRAREDTIQDRKSATFRLTAFLLRHDLRSTGRANWRPAHLRWLSEIVCATAAPPLVLQAYVRAVSAHADRLGRLEQELQAQGKAWRLDPLMEALQGRRGVPCPVAVPTVAELGDLTRFDNPRQLMGSRGLTPSEYSRGQRRRQGGITKAGNTHARRALMEGAWASRSLAKGRRHLQLRLATRPKDIQAISWKAQGRLCKR